MYVTINDIVLNEGTSTSSAARSSLHQLQEPRSLPVDRGAHAHHLGGVPQRRDVTFLVDELKAVFDPRAVTGSRWQVHALDHRRARYVIEKHLQSIGLIARPSSIRTSRSWSTRSAPSSRRAPAGRRLCQVALPGGAQLCGRCSTAAVVMMDGCMTA